MIKCNTNKINAANNWDDEEIHVLADFDRTITSGNSQTSWGVLAKPGLLPDEYITECDKNFDYYRPLELNPNINLEAKNRLMIEWWTKHINLFIKYKLSETVIKEATTGTDFMSFRDGAKDFLTNMAERNIPVLIISAGIGNFIEQFLINNGCNFANIHVISNFLRFENGVAVGILGTLVHSHNKNEAAISPTLRKLIANRPNIILFGDQLSDIDMAKESSQESTLKIGFINEEAKDNIPYFEQNFDITCNGGFDELSNEFRLLRTSKKF